MLYSIKNIIRKFILILYNIMLYSIKKNKHIPFRIYYNKQLWKFANTSNNKIKKIINRNYILTKHMCNIDELKYNFIIDNYKIVIKLTEINYKQLEECILLTDEDEFMEIISKSNNINDIIHYYKMGFKKYNL